MNVRRSSTFLCLSVFFVIVRNKPVLSNVRFVIRCRHRVIDVVFVRDGVIFVLPAPEQVGVLIAVRCRKPFKTHVETASPDGPVVLTVNPSAPSYPAPLFVSMRLSTATRSASIHWHRVATLIRSLPAGQTTGNPRVLKRQTGGSSLVNDSGHLATAVRRYEWRAAGGLPWLFAAAPATPPSATYRSDCGWYAGDAAIATGWRRVRQEPARRRRKRGPAPQGGARVESHWWKDGRTDKKVDVHAVIDVWRRMTRVF
jgi:hypothetical protein